ncbi:tetratricopeptide repeat protein [Roseofilum sp. BLCC_M143]|uniref:Tetratricopeptide repeat protein n=1 Tax=Roseofilum casamattae BLCC-M143 TaxID=3022442 RepID=A0ABT7C3K8_9CYAN|nr:tetratricopeptide repeat protein [Roseofilum casamattae BLCC-M143]
MTQNNLANAYNNRIRGERAENIEKAIGVKTHIPHDKM